MNEPFPPSVQPHSQFLTIAHAAERLAAGDVVAFPTETVYGLGADAENDTAIERVFALKQRPRDHPLIVHIRGPEAIDYWAHGPLATAYRLAERFWPGPLTLILAKTERVSTKLTADQPSVAIRAPAHPLAQSLLAQYAALTHSGAALAAPSANRFGQLSPTLAAHVHAAFGDHVAVVDGGECGVGVESTILDLGVEPARILRPGMISADELAETLGYAPIWTPLARDDREATNRDATPHVSGQYARHYAPATPTQLVDRESLRRQLHNQAGRRIGLLVYGQREELADELDATDEQQTIFLPASPSAYAQGLYAALHRLDAAAVELIYVLRPPDAPAWVAINDRLQRATTRLS